MIDRYSITASTEALHERFGVEVLNHYKPRYNAAPTQLLPVITSSAPQGLSFFYWGRPASMSGNKPLGEKLINVHLETLLERPRLASSLLKKRCIIPADGFYAWKKTGKKSAIPHRIVVGDEIFAMAGLWEEFEEENGEMLHCFSIITMPSNNLVATVTERMPVILGKDSEPVWLSATHDISLLIGQLVAFPPGRMSLYPVTPRIADPRTDLPSMILPTPPADQYGNLTLFD